MSGQYFFKDNIFITISATKKSISFYVLFLLSSVSFIFLNSCKQIHIFVLKNVLCSSESFKTLVLESLKQFV